MSCVRNKDFQTCTVLCSDLSARTQAQPSVLDLLSRSRSGSVKKRKATISKQLRNQTKHMPPQRMSEKSGVSKSKRPKSSIAQRRLTTKMPLSKRNPDLALKISQMRLTIAPIVHVETGIAAPDFPATMLSLFLLTEDQLDAMAHYYSQVSPSELTDQYPQGMDWSKPFLCTDAELPENCKLDELERVKVKMRMFARFIGMRGAETPTWEYERQVEILSNKIQQTIIEEEMSLRKSFLGSRYRP